MSAQTPRRWVGKQLVKDALAELADRPYQDKVWLGEGDTEMSSFEEAHSRLFDDSALGRAFDRGDVVFDERIDAALVELGRLLRKVDDDQLAPEDVVVDDRMGPVRSAAASLLFAIVRLESLTAEASDS